MFKKLLLLITCQLITTTFSASIFGINLEAPRNSIKKQINQVFHLFGNPKQEFNYEVNSPIPYYNHGGNEAYKSYDNTYYPASNKKEETSSFAPQEGPDLPYKVTPNRNQNYIQYNPPPVNVNSRGSFYTTKEPKPSTLVTSELYPEKKNNSISNHIIEPAFDPDAIVFDYSTTVNSDYDWTTTDEPLNRIGAPPAIVASLLGGG